jgi:hypothetical protein
MISLVILSVTLTTVSNFPLVAPVISEEGMNVIHQTQVPCHRRFLVVGPSTDEKIHRDKEKGGASGMKKK